MDKNLVIAREALVRARNWKDSYEQASRLASMYLDLWKEDIRLAKSQLDQYEDPV
jgi:hypothetical protein